MGAFGGVGTPLAHQRITRYGNLEWDVIPSGSLGPIEWDGTQEWTDVEHDPVADLTTQFRLLFMTFTGLFGRSVFTELRNNCYPLFTEYTHLYTSDLRPPPEGMRIELVHPVGAMIISLNWTSLTGDKNGEALRDAILAWATQWNLNSEWCRDHALQVMLRWQGEEGAGRADDYDAIDEQAILELHSIGPNALRESGP